MKEAVFRYPKFHLRHVPFITKDALPTTLIDRRVTVLAAKPEFYPEDRARTRGQGLPIERSLAAHHGYLPLGYEQEVAGLRVMSIADRTKWIGNGANSFYKRMQRDLFSELYGKDSFLQEFMRGETSYENFRVCVTNWDLSMRICQTVPATETAAL